MKNNTESRLDGRRRFTLPIISVVVLTSTSFTSAQTVPTELLDLSIEDLFETRVVRSEDNISASKRWVIASMMCAPGGRYGRTTRE